MIHDWFFDFGFVIELGFFVYHRQPRIIKIGDGVFRGEGVVTECEGRCQHSAAHHPRAFGWLHRLHHRGSR